MDALGHFQIICKPLNIGKAVIEQRHTNFLNANDYRLCIRLLLWP